MCDLFLAKPLITIHWGRKEGGGSGSGMCTLWSAVWWAWAQYLFRYNALSGQQKELTLYNRIEANPQSVELLELIGLCVCVFNLLWCVMCSHVFSVCIHYTAHLLDWNFRWKASSRMGHHRNNDKKILCFHFAIFFPSTYFTRMAHSTQIFKQHSHTHTHNQTSSNKLHQLSDQNVSALILPQIVSN